MLVFLRLPNVLKKKKKETNKQSQKQLHPAKTIKLILVAVKQYNDS